MPDRRQPLGGVTKDAYVHGGGHELTYDLLSGIKSDLCWELKQTRAEIAEIKLDASCRPDTCDKKYVTRKQLCICLAICGAFFLGVGIINWQTVVEIIDKLI